MIFALSVLFIVLGIFLVVFKKPITKRRKRLAALFFILSIAINLQEIISEETTTTSDVTISGS